MKLTFILILFAFAIKIVNSQNIIIDHRSVDQYDLIPIQYIDSVKKMWVNIPGESHSSGYRKGCFILNTLNPVFNAVIRESGTPDGSSDTALRISRASWGDVSSAMGWQYSYGEEDWFTSSLAVERTKAYLTYANTHNFEISAIGFGWCWDMTWQNSPGGTIDPLYQVRWAGSSTGGPQGSMRWGLNDEDSLLTGNSVSMDTYLNATMQYIKHCSDSGYNTKVFFTTGPVDGGGNYGESGYQRYLKHEYIRKFINENDSLILFDYADILTWGNDSSQNLIAWNDHGGTVQTFPYIHPDNMLDLDGTYAEDGDHIGQRGAVRLAKALWVMLARIAGWEGPINEYITRIDASICEGETYFAQGAAQNTEGIYYDTITASSGLDSIIITKLTVNNSYNIAIDSVLYFGDSILFAGKYIKAKGFYSDTLQTTKGCDSIITLHLDFQCTLDYKYEDIWICQGDSTLIGGLYYKVEGVYPEIFENVYGCDSIILYNLIVNQCIDNINNEYLHSITIFPNPACSSINISFVKKYNEYTLTLVSPTGQAVFIKKYIDTVSLINENIDISDYTPGIYLIRIENSEFQYHQKIVKL